jgi:serine/threonine protein kinase
MVYENFQRVRELFDAALELDPTKRAAFVARACRGDPTVLGKVQRLLDAHDQTKGFLEKPAGFEGRVLGGYQILSRIGGGGMGIVYFAQRVDGPPGATFAVKVLRPGYNFREILRRFRVEREVLASLDHSGIARLIDAGRTDTSLPYFVMEYVDGIPLDRHILEKNPTREERLRLFVDVCEIADYAHRRNVVHRDLKPGNILVHSGKQPNAPGVKLLDFGIAKFLGRDLIESTFRTPPGMQMMTLAYASPEQIAGNTVSPATDVFSLGVILYEMLSGERPYRLQSGFFHECLSAIMEQQPPPLSEETDDLNTIIAKALEKDPVRRYQTAGALADEIRRLIA